MTLFDERESMEFTPLDILVGNPYEDEATHSTNNLTSLWNWI